VVSNQVGSITNDERKYGEDYRSLIGTSGGLQSVTTGYTGYTGYTSESANATGVLPESRLATTMISVGLSNSPLKRDSYETKYSGYEEERIEHTTTYKSTQEIYKVT